jgi:hypothetical protein
MNHMTKLEKIALTSAVSGAIFNVFLYGIGATLTDATGGPLFYARAVAAVLQAAAFDLVAIATVTGMYRGRRSGWSMLTAVTAAAVSILIALDVAGVWSQPWLHAANALIVLVFTLHLLAPQKSSRARQLRATVRRLCAIVRHERATTDQLAAQLRQALETVRQFEAQPRRLEPQEVIIVSERQFSLRQLAQLTDTPLTTLRRKVAQIEAQEVAP